MSDTNRHIKVWPVALTVEVDDMSRELMTVPLLRADSLIRCESSLAAAATLSLRACQVVSKISRIHLPCLLGLISKASRAHVLAITSCRNNYYLSVQLVDKRRLPDSHQDQPCRPQ
jgi:hypothetical protein